MQGMKAILQCTGSQEGYAKADKSKMRKKENVNEAAMLCPWGFS